jgi:nicotinamide-nucleotide amidase
LNCIILVGNQLICNSILKEYILTATTNIDAEAILKISNHIEIDNVLDFCKTRYNNIYIFVDKNHFTYISKIVSSKIDDQLIYIDGILVPSKSQQITKDGFTLKIENNNISILQIDSNIGFKNKIPILDNNRQEYKTFQVLNNNKANIIPLIAPLVDVYNISYEIIDIIDSWCQIKIKITKTSEYIKFWHSLKELLDNQLIETDNLLKTITLRLKQSNQTIAFAESCTGGLLASMLTDISGSSDVFNGSIVSYSNGLKVNWLNVNKKNIVNYGAVSSEVVSDMLTGIISASKSDISIAISGIAGPNGGTKSKPVGTVVIGCMYKGDQNIVTKHFNGDRTYIKYQSVYFAISLIYQTMFANKRDN